MFGIFKILGKKRKNSSPVYTGWNKLEQAVEKKQRKWAVYMGQKVKSWPLSYVRIAFGLFCLSYGGLCVYQIAIAFQQPPAVMQLDRISTPSHIIQNDARKSPLQSAFITDSIYLRIKIFREYMDSLKYDHEGRIVYDSIVKARPGLMDSVNDVELIYKQQKK